MGRNNFRKALKHIESRSVDNNIARLNDELKKTGMLSEKMTTSTVLPPTITQTYIPPTISDVPDTSGLMGNDFSQPTNGGDENDPSTWETGWSNNDYLKNPNTLDGEENRPILANVANVDYPYDDGGGSSTILFGNIAYGISVGVVGGANGYRQILIGGLGGGTNRPTERSRESGGIYRHYDDDQFAYAEGLYNTYIQLKERLDAGEIGSGVVKVWKNYSRFHDGGGSFDGYSGGPKKSGDGSKKILIGMNYFKVANTYTSDPGRPRTTVLNRFEDPSSPDFYEGNFSRYMSNLLNIGRRAFDYLVGASDDFLSGDPNLSDVALQQASERQKAISNDPKVAKAAEQLGTAGKVFYDYLTNNLPDVIDNDYLGSKYVKSIFKDAQVNQLGTVTVGDNIVGTGGKATYNSETNEVSIPFNYDFKTNDEEFSDPSKAGYVSGPLGQFRKAVLNAIGEYTVDAHIATPIPPLNSLAGIVFGTAIGISKGLGGAEQKKGNVTINADELKKLNPVFHTQVVERFKVDSYEPQGEVLSEGWQSPDHTNVEKDPKTRWFSPNAGTDAAKWFDPKEVKPIYPEEPPEMIDGYNAKSNLAPKLVDKPPAIKLTKKDLLRNHRLKDSEIEEMMQTIDRINKFIAAHPEELIYAKSRYPKHDPRLAELNWKMDQMLNASNEYLDKQFPENERLFNRLKSATQKTIELTDPETYKKDPGKLTSMGNLAKVDSVMNHYEPKDRSVSKIKVKKKKSVNRFFAKPKRPDRPAYLRKKKKGKPNS